MGKRECSYGALQIGVCGGGSAKRMGHGRKYLSRRCERREDERVKGREGMNSSVGGEER